MGMLEFIFWGKTKVQIIGIKIRRCYNDDKDPNDKKGA